MLPFPANFPALDYNVRVGNPADFTSQIHHATPSANECSPRVSSGPRAKYMELICVANELLWRVSFSLKSGTRNTTENSSKSPHKQTSGKISHNIIFRHCTILGVCGNLNRVRCAKCEKDSSARKDDICGYLIWKDRLSILLWVPDSVKRFSIRGLLLKNSPRKPCISTPLSITHILPPF